MECQTVKRLKSMAKEREFKRYSQLRKAELIEMLSTESMPAPRRSVEKPVPAPRTNIEMPVPAPRTNIEKPVPAPRPNKVLETIKSYVKPTLKQVKKAFDWSKTKALALNSFISKNLNDLIGWAKKPSQPKEKPSLSEYVKEELKESEPQFFLHAKALKGFMKTYRAGVILRYLL